MSDSHPGKKHAYLAVMKFTGKPLNKSKSKQHAAYMRRDIMSYSDQEGKQVAQERKNWVQEKNRDDEGRLERSKKPFSPEVEEDTLAKIPLGMGTPFLGGFLKNQGIPEEPRKGKNFLKNWTNRVVESWEALLRKPKYNKKRFLRYNAVISLTAGREQELIHAGFDPQLYLKEVAERTGELYIKSRGNKLDPKDRVGFYAGVHFDKDHIHVHLRFFPTTEFGVPLTASNNKKGPAEDQSRIKWIQMANEAAESWWRENMPDKTQRPDVRLARMHNKPDPEILGMNFFTSDSKMVEFPRDHADQILDQLVSCANTLVQLDKIPTPKIEKPLAQPQVLRRLSALEAYEQSQKWGEPEMIPGLPQFEGSQTQKKKNTQGWLFQKTWSAIAKGSIQKITDLVNWARERSEKIFTAEERARKKETARILRKDALETLSSVIRSEVRKNTDLRTPEVVPPSPQLHNDLGTTMELGLGIQEALDVLKGPGSNQLRLRVLNLHQNERNQIEQNTPAGRLLALDLAKRIDAETLEDQTTPQDPLLQAWACRCALEAAHALEEESRHDPVNQSSHLGELTLLRIEQVRISERQENPLNLAPDQVMEIDLNTYDENRPQLRRRAGPELSPLELERTVELPKELEDSIALLTGESPVKPPQEFATPAPAPTAEEIPEEEDPLSPDSPITETPTSPETRESAESPDLGPILGPALERVRKLSGRNLKLPSKKKEPER